MLFAWRRRLTRAGGSGAQVFKPVKLAGEPKARRPRAADDDRHADGTHADGGIEVCLSGRRRLIVRRGFDRQLLLDLLDALETRPLESRS